MLNNQNTSELMPVNAALNIILETLPKTQSKIIPLTMAHGCYLANDIIASLTLPTHDVSSMDGYAIRAADAVTSPANFTRVGESAAGHPWQGKLHPNQAVRIFTGAHIPNGADCVVIQENASSESNSDGALITLLTKGVKGRYIRPAGLDIKAGDIVIKSGTYLSARCIGLAIAAGETNATVSISPRIGILSTGDELVAPGETPGPSQIISSNALFLSAFVKSCGAQPVDLGIAFDTPGAIHAATAKAKNLDMVVTTGGASVGSHDHVAGDLLDGALYFWKVAMRPGKPLIWGNINNIPLLGLPGNPVSTAICALVFLQPAIAKLSGGHHKNNTFSVPITTNLTKNDLRQDYVRATFENEGGCLKVRPAYKQDSSMMAVLAGSDALIVRPPFDPPKRAGELVDVLPLPRQF